ncbi:MAG: segregation/condensation protein A [Candidatus Micrarchaeota archaeon]
MEQMDLEKLVVQPTWRDVLMDLVIEEKLDPWDIDIIQVTEKYLKKIQTLQSLDLRIPANIILAAAILLRFKSETLKLVEEEQVVTEEVYVGDEGAPTEVPILSLRTRIPPKRRVNLNELINTLSEVIDAQKRRASNAFRPRPIMSIEIPKEDIEERMNSLFDRVKEIADDEGLLLFSDLVCKKGSREVVMLLLPLLHLAQNRKIDLMQEKMFGEIFIRILGKDHGNESKTNN